MRRFFICLLAIMVLTSCVTKIPLPNACDTLQGPSMLCQLAEENNVNLTVFADGLGLANIVAVERGAYSKEDALKVLSRIRMLMDSPMSYLAFKLEIEEVLKKYPYLLRTTDRYLGQLVSSSLIYEEDRRLIIARLDMMIADLGGGS